MDTNIQLHTDIIVEICHRMPAVDSLGLMRCNKYLYGVISAQCNSITDPYWYKMAEGNSLGLYGVGQWLTVCGNRVLKRGTVCITGAKINNLTAVRYPELLDEYAIYIIVRDYLCVRRAMGIQPFQSPVNMVNNYYIPSILPSIRLLKQVKFIIASKSNYTMNNHSMCLGTLLNYVEYPLV